MGIAKALGIGMSAESSGLRADNEGEIQPYFFALVFAKTIPNPRGSFAGFHCKQY
jgi:hypothetical protein